LEGKTESPIENSNKREGFSTSVTKAGEGDKL
jgi:hypothetical protein